MSNTGGVPAAWLLGGLMIMATATVSGAPARPLAAFTVEVDLGEDDGRNPGSLFEVRDAEGRVVLGAGFAGVYNTMFRTDRHTLQFFFRPKEDADQFTLERLPRPSEDGGTYLFDLDGKVHAMGYVHDSAARRWEDAAGRWEDDRSFEGTRHGEGRMRVGDGILEFRRGAVRYKDATILPPPAEGDYHHFYYANGHLVFYHSKREEPPYGKLLACPWKPGDPPIDPAKARVHSLKYPRETPFAFGQMGREVLTCSNIGGLYAFDGKEWRVLREPDDKVSYQIYSMVNYPSGTLFEYDGKEVRSRQGWPPVPAGVSPSAREAQTTMIYRGELFVGVWPWGELWRYDRDADRWIAMGRLFKNPPTTDKVVHPFEQEIRDYNAANGTKLVFNDWGQRVTGMVPAGDSLYLSTSAKGTWPRDTRMAFLTDEVFQQYGAVHRLKMPGNLAAVIGRPAGPTRLRFVLEPDRMLLFQDDRPLGETRLDPKLTAGLRRGRVSWGEGVFGPLAGKIRSKSEEWSVKGK